MLPTIAVVIPNYNDSKSVAACLDSVLDQEVAADQIIIVDDHSTDNSLAIIQDKVASIVNSEVVVNANQLGTMGALNEGLKRVSADYVLFLSANDYLKPGIFRRAKSHIAADRYPGIWSALVSIVDRNGRESCIYPSPIISFKRTYLTPDKCIRLSMIVGHWFPGMTTIFHRETLQSIGGFDVAYKGLADMLAALTIASVKGASFSPEPLGVMRLHDRGFSRNTFTDLNCLDSITDRISVHGPMLSPRLFTDRFCDVMRRRIRFTAIRTSGDNSWQRHIRNWQGTRYRLVSLITPCLGRLRTLQLTVLFILIRPPLDLLSIIWYRIFGSAFIVARNIVR